MTLLGGVVRIGFLNKILTNRSKMLKVDQIWMCGRLLVTSRGSMCGWLLLASRGSMPLRGPLLVTPRESPSSEVSRMVGIQGPRGLGGLTTGAAVMIGAPERDGRDTKKPAKMQ